MLSVCVCVCECKHSLLFIFIYAELSEVFRAKIMNFNRIVGSERERQRMSLRLHVNKHDKILSRMLSRTHTAAARSL
jgi:hypothetical protein